MCTGGDGGVFYVFILFGIATFLSLFLFLSAVCFCRLPRGTFWLTYQQQCVREEGERERERDQLLRTFPYDLNQRKELKIILTFSSASTSQSTVNLLIIISVCENIYPKKKYEKKLQNCPSGSLFFLVGKKNIMYKKFLKVNQIWNFPLSLARGSEWLWSSISKNMFAFPSLSLTCARKGNFHLPLLPHAANMLIMRVYIIRLESEHTSSCEIIVSNANWAIITVKWVSESARKCSKCCSLISQEHSKFLWHISLTLSHSLALHFIVVVNEMNNSWNSFDFYKAHANSPSFSPA